MRISDWSSDVCSSDLGLVHGRMKGPDKDAVMARFQAGEIGVLVATTVIEVGVDVPAASLMIIEHAENLDRQSVVSGQSLSGRVDLGGRRNIKKKNKN